MQYSWPYPARYGNYMDMFPAPTEAQAMTDKESFFNIYNFQMQISHRTITSCMSSLWQVWVVTAWVNHLHPHIHIYLSLTSALCPPGSTGDSLEVWRELDMQRVEDDLRGVLSRGIHSLAVLLLHSYTSVYLPTQTARVSPSLLSLKIVVVCV